MQIVQEPDDNDGLEGREKQMDDGGCQEEGTGEGEDDFDWDAYFEQENPGIYVLGNPSRMTRL